MAINIYSGGSSGNKSGKSKVNSASNTIRAQQARAALAVPAETSASGTTAVGSKGILGKIGNFFGKAAQTVGKFLPGIGGKIASAIGNFLNDPEWWQSCPGDALTLNDPLRIIQYPEQQGSYSKQVTFHYRYAICEILSFHRPTIWCTLGPSGDPVKHISPSAVPEVISLTDNIVTQYLLPEIRKVVNAIPLQLSESYRKVFEANTAIYAMWQQLKKMDYMVKHGTTYIANLNNAAFPLLMTSNASYLQSAINRLEEYLRANVRLPHTLCEYLAFRFGRVYKSNDSAKAALILYNAMPLAADVNVWDDAIGHLMNVVSGSASNQQANADIYNAYFDHDYQVHVRDDTQFVFDVKEFALRCNLNGIFTANLNFDGNDTRFGKTIYNDGTLAPRPEYSRDNNYIILKSAPVCIDSKLDNPTAFMASTVSTVAVGKDGKNHALFPVCNQIACYIPSPWTVYNNGRPGDTVYDSLGLGIGNITNLRWTGMLTEHAKAAHSWATVLDETLFTDNPGDSVMYNPDPVTQSDWAVTYVPIDTPVGIEDTSGAFGLHTQAMCFLPAVKSLDLYNLGLFMPLGMAAAGTGARGVGFLDITTLSIDEGQPTDYSIDTEHIYAFANLVAMERKTSTTYSQAEKLVAKDTANLVESVDVATSATK